MVRPNFFTYAGCLTYVLSTIQLNFMCLFRPTKEEIDVLEEFGNAGWNWEDLLGYFKKVRA